MSTNTTPTEKELCDALAVAATWEQFGKALQKFRMTTQPGLSLRKMQHNFDLPSRSAISSRENGEKSFTEQQIRTYLHECKAVHLIDYCIKHHRRVAQSLQAIHGRPAAQAPPDPAPRTQSPIGSDESPTSGEQDSRQISRTLHTHHPSYPAPTVAAPSASGLTSREIPAPEAEAARLLQKADSYGENGAVQRAANIAAEAVSMCDAIYGPDHQTTLHARAVELRWASEVFTESCHALNTWQKEARLQEAFRQRGKDTALLRQRWETLIGEYQRVYGTGHRKTLHMSRHYAYHIWQTYDRAGGGLGTRELLLYVLVELIVEAEHSLGRTDEFTLQMRWALTVCRNNWRALADQFRQELGSEHPMTYAAMREVNYRATKGIPNYWHYTELASVPPNDTPPQGVNFLSYDRM